MDIQIDNLRKIYGDKVIFHNLTITIPTGKISALVGPSGIGKTTFLKILAGIEKDYEGEISGLKKRTISMVFQENRLIPHYTGRENVQLIPSSNTSEEIEKLFTLFHLTKDLDNPVSTYSGGMKRRVALIRALIADFHILLLDEPFAGLDGELMEITAREIQKYGKGKTILFTSHKSEEIQLLEPDSIITLE